MKVFTDLHIHTALSPCADKSMTPNDIVNMALLKELDVIAITDHNSAENAGAVLKCAEGTKLTVIPGMELETMEEVHVICLFPDLKASLSMQKVVYDSLPNLANREDIFGAQIVMDEHDEVVGKIDRMLITASGLSIEEVLLYVGNLGGVAIPAHVDRQSYSIISNLGMVPDHLDIKFLEVSRLFDLEKDRKAFPGVRDYQLIKSSDAHMLGDILEREFFLELKEISIGGIISKLRNG
jgi:PHP family Zn ribbon phosphoesterase